MIKKFRVKQLKPRMLIHSYVGAMPGDSSCRPGNRVRSYEDIRAILAKGIAEVYVDTRNSQDDPNALSLEAVDQALEAQMRDLRQDSLDDLLEPVPVLHDFEQELSHAVTMRQETVRVMRGLLDDVRTGRALDLDPVRQSVEKMMDSIDRSSGALTSLALLRGKDGATYAHSVNVGVLLIAFCKEMAMDHATTMAVGMGGLLHDMGKMRLPEALLKKTGSLTQEEMRLVRMHVTLGRQLLEVQPNISPITLMVVAQHHERYNGSGYPKGLFRNQSSMPGQMAAIVDVYDALTSRRPYRSTSLDSHEALRQMTGMKGQFNDELFQQFIRCIGIYPQGSIVRLKNGQVGVVVHNDVHALLHPVVRVVYDEVTQKRLKPRTLHLQQYRDRPDFAIDDYLPVGSHEIDPVRFMPMPQAFQ